MSRTSSSLFTGAILLWLPLATTAPAQSQVTLDVGVWDVQPAGTVSLGASGQPGSEADLESDLNYQDSDRTLQGTAYIGETHQLALSYLNFDSSARTTLSRPLTLGPTAFPEAAVLSTAWDVQLMGAGYRYVGGSDAWQSGFLVGLQHVSAELTVSAEDTPRSRGDLTSWCPVIGVFANWQPAMIAGLHGSLNGGAWDTSSTSMTYMDAQASVRLLLYPFVAGLGYRHLACQGDDTSQPFELDIRFSGPVLMAGLAF